MPVIRPALIFLTLAACALAPGFLRAQPDPFETARYAEPFQPVLQIPGEYINDHCLIRHDGVWHLFYTSGRIATAKPADTGAAGGARPTLERWSRPGNEVSIGHATSRDLKNWTVGPPAITVGPAGSIDAGHVYAPSVIKVDSLFYMMYTSADGPHFRAEHLVMATSPDLITWTRRGDTAVFHPSPEWAEYYEPDSVPGRPGPTSFRDPHLTFDPRSGFLCYYVARLRYRAPDGMALAAVAVATSPDLVNWTDRGPVLVRRVYGEDYYTWTHPESPSVVKKGLYWYLFWKGGSGTRVSLSTDPLNFHDREAYFLSTSHASEIVQAGRDWFITSCSRKVEDFAHSSTDRTQGLSIAKLTWRGLTPIVGE